MPPTIPRTPSSLASTRRSRRGSPGTTDRNPDRAAGRTDEGGGRGRAVGPGIALPTGRAMVGGLLVAISALGIFVGHRAATTPDRHEWLVVRRPVAAGATISADDLALAPMDLTDPTRRRALSKPSDLVGKVALVPLVDGDLVMRSTVADPAAMPDRPGRRLGLSLGRSEALGGDVAVGDRVDVLSVPAADGDEAIVVAHGAIVTSLGAEGDGVGATDQVRLTLDVADEATARKIVEAHAHGGVTLIAPSTMAAGAEP